MTWPVGPARRACVEVLRSSRVSCLAGSPFAWLGQSSRALACRGPQRALARSEKPGLGFGRSALLLNIVPRNDTNISGDIRAGPDVRPSLFI